MRQFTYVSHKPAIYIASLLIACIVIFPSCDDGNGCIDGSGGTITKEITIEPFHSVITEGAWDVAFEQGTEQAVSVEGMENIIADITTDVSNGVWEIGLKGDCYNNLDLLIYIRLPDIKSIESAGADQVVLNSFDSLDNLEILVSGSGQLFQSGTLNVTDKLTMQSTGSGDMTAHFNSQRVDALISGSGNMALSGSTNSQNITLTGSGNYNALGLTSSECIINNSGAGDAEVTVQDTLSAIISGSGNVSYQGDTAAVSSTITGSGSLIKL